MGSRFPLYQASGPGGTEQGPCRGDVLAVSAAFGLWTQGSGGPHSPGEEEVWGSPSFSLAGSHPAVPESHAVDSAASFQVTPCVTQRAVCPTANDFTSLGFRFPVYTDE